MSIRSKIMLSIAVGAGFTALAAAEIAVSGAKPAAAVAAIAAAFCVAAVVIGLFIADSIAAPLGKVRRSLAEISALALRNADNSMWAKLLAAESNAAAGDGDAAVKRMAEAVNWMKASSDNNAKIVKMVNYMALRANFLAFNAAIAAAHAGKAGNDFSYVADEMRSFAIRCARAAQNTADMIEESANDVDRGIKTAEKVADAIRTVVDRADNVGGMVAEIANLSDKQVQCVERANAAAARINSAACADAADSAEPADAAEEVGDVAPEHANTTDDFVPDADNKRYAAALSSRQKRYAAYPYQKAFSAAALAFWAPMRAADAEEPFTIEDCEMWR